MAAVDAVLSLTIADEAGERIAMPLYVTGVDSQTIAQLFTAMDTLVAATDDVTDGVITRIRVILNMPLTAGIKGSAAAGSDNEETGLVTFELESPAGKAFAYDIPAVAQAILDTSDLKKIDKTNAAFVTWATLVSTASTWTFKNNLWSSGLGSVRSALKTFRTHRRAAKRA